MLKHKFFPKKYYLLKDMREEVELWVNSNHVDVVCIAEYEDGILVWYKEAKP